MKGLTPESALIFRITHVANVPWILANGLYCSNSDVRDPQYVQIGNADLIAKRAQRPVPLPPGGVLGDYIPFYFTPASPMLLNIKTGFNNVTQRSMGEIAMIVSSLRRIHELGIGFVFTDRHAYLQAAEFYNQLDSLDRVDWAILQSRNFKRDLDDPGKFERYQAEALIHRHVPVAAVETIACYGLQQQQDVQKHCDDLGLPIKASSKPAWYL